MNVVVATALCVVVATGAFAAFRAKAWFDAVFDRADPDCVSRSLAENNRLADAIAPYLPSVRPDDIEGGHGCGPSDDGPWIEVELPGASAEDALREFRPPTWTAVPAEKTREWANHARRVKAVTGEIDDRSVEVYALENYAGEGSALVRAWFSDH
ncbi:hypothetical protein AB0M95_40750 [Sphaerisporangium sp. NPDC051017]|uniref:hypothetical protein n=1 Tax=Sphaerisporangium sp. NPDC051017 TaxID=3154636 RepID=UPI003426FEC1